MLEVKVNVQIGVTPEVVSLVSAILNKPAAVEAPAAAAPAAAEETTQQPAARRGRPKKTEAPAEPEAPAAPAAAAPEAAPADTGDMPDEVFYPQEEDVRTAMHQARCRIEGEDYKDKPSDDLHRAVTDVFKAIANDLSGQKKPSALPQELRQAFIDAARTVQQGEDGKFTYTVNKQ
jgi:cell pole-organizing protein PopZ